jgi:hypothetical protein
MEVWYIIYMFPYGNIDFWSHETLFWPMGSCYLAKLHLGLLQLHMFVYILIKVKTKIPVFSRSFLWNDLLLLSCSVYVCVYVCVCVQCVSCGQTVHRWNRIFWILIYIFILDTRWCSQNFVSAHLTASLLLKLDLEKNSKTSKPLT